MKQTMRIPSSAKLVVATWLAALLGALAGRSLAQSSSCAHGERTHANVVVTKSVATINRN
jgi:hypothetical protein